MLKFKQCAYNPMKICRLPFLDRTKYGNPIAYKINALLKEKEVTLKRTF